MNDQTWTNACLVCGIDIINERCGCSNFADLVAERRGDTSEEWYIALDASGSLPEGIEILCPMVHVGYLWLDGKRVSVARPAMESGVKLATYSEESSQFSLWDPTDTGAEDEGSEATD